jgi:hypothetical protein
MPHFECGAFNHSATSPESVKGLSGVAQYLAAEAARDKGAPPLRPCTLNPLERHAFGLVSGPKFGIQASKTAH